MKAACTIEDGGDISNETLYQFLVNDPQFAGFYLLPKTKSDCMMSLARLLIPTVCTKLKTYLFSWIFIYNLLQKL